jgi:DnaK suppressor protein
VDRATMLYFRDELEKQLAQLSIRLQSEFLSPDSHGDDPVPKDEVDLATARAAREWTFRMQSRNHRLRVELCAALQRIGDGDFGVCERCADDIDIKRLQANPWTRFCIGCKRAQESFEQRKVA